LPHTETSDLLETTMSEQTQRATQSGDANLADPLVQMIHGLGGTVRREVEQLRAEATQRATGGAKGAGLLIAAGATGSVAVAAAVSLPLMALRRLLPSWAIAVLVAGGAGASTVLLTRRGLAELGAAAPVDAGRLKDAARDAVRSVT
jgi:Putative Actinobacterial Holin-X, holin superfamily III